MRTTALPQRAPARPLPAAAEPKPPEAPHEAADAGVPRYLLAVQRRCERCAAAPEGDDRDGGALQAEAAADTASAPTMVAERARPAALHAIAAKGVSGADQPLPQRPRIQAAFGRHDVSRVRVQVGGPAAATARAMGARAYAFGSRIGFAAEPDIRLAAHEATHVVQQRRGVQLDGGVGTPGDRYERQADAVAERVVAGESAEDLLDDGAPAAQPRREAMAESGSWRVVQAQCACGGGCAPGACTAAEDEEREPAAALQRQAAALQFDVETNAVRLHEPDAAASARGGGDAGSGSGDDAGEDPATAASRAEEAAAAGEDEAPEPVEGTGSGGEPAGPALPADNAADAEPGAPPAAPPPAPPTPPSAGTAPPTGTGGGPPGPPAPAAPAAASTPAATPQAAPPASPAAAPAAAAPACSGGGVARCYRAPTEEPDPEPQETPPNPQPTQAQEQMSGDDAEVDLEAPDVCPAQEAIAAEAGSAPGNTMTAGAPPGTASGSASTMPAGAPGPAEAAAPIAGVDAVGAAIGGTAASGGPAGPPDAAEGATTATVGAGSPLEAAIARAESMRAAAAAGYSASRSDLVAAGERTAALRRGTRFVAAVGENPVQAERRRRSAVRADAFFARVADRLDGEVALALGDVPDRLGSQAESAKASLAASIEMQKLAVSTRIEAARVAARASAASARQAVRGQAAAFVALARAQASAALATLRAAHGESSAQVGAQETTALAEVNRLYAEGRTAHEALGTTIGAECVARGEAFAAQYEGFKNCTEDGFWDGNLSERRAIAQQNAARETAAGYQRRLVESANKRAREVTRAGRQSDRCAVIAAASSARDTLDTQLANLEGALEAARDATIAQAGVARDALLAQIAASLRATLAQYDVQECEQRQAANDTGYLQQVVQEQLAHAAAAALQRGVAEAVREAQAAFARAQADLAAGATPEPAVLEDTLRPAMARVDGALDSLADAVSAATLGAGQQLATAAAGGTATLAAVATGNDLTVAATEAGYAGAMGSIAASDHFAALRTGFGQQVEQSATGGTAALHAAVGGMQQACTAVTTQAATALADSQRQLEHNLRDSQKGLDCEITSKADEAASHKAPAWKRLIAVLLVILVIVIVVAVIILSAGSAGILAGIVIGAIVGAVTSGMLAMASNLWNNRPTMRGVGHAILVGAVTGAIGGGLGAWAGTALRSASGVVQHGAQLVLAVALDVGTQLVEGGFSIDRISGWQVLQTVAITIVTLGIGARAGAARGGGAHATEPVAPGAHGAEPAPAVHAGEPVPAAHRAEPAPAARPGEGATAAPVTEPAPTAHPTEPTPAAHPAEPAPTATGEAAPAAHPTETMPAAAGMEPAPPTHTAESKPTAPGEAPAGAPAEPSPGARASEPAPPAPVEGEMPRPGSPEEAAVLEGSAGKSADELTPGEALTERQAARDGESRPIDDPPFTTETELPNGHKVRETPEGTTFERCSAKCQLFDADGNPIGEGTPEAPPQAPDEVVPNAPDETTTPNGPEDAVPNAPEELAPNAPEEAAPLAPDEGPRPWDQGDQPRRYRDYQRRQLRKGREVLGPEQWWQRHGSRPPRNPGGGEGRADHVAKVAELRAEAQAAYPPPRYRVTSNEMIPGLRRKPDVAVIDTTTGEVVRVYEAARFRPSGGFRGNYEAPKIADYDAHGIPYEFHPVGPNQPPGGVLRGPAPSGGAPPGPTN